jgi:hypothetical protein
MEENMHDMIVLLSGIGHNLQAVYDYFKVSQTIGDGENSKVISMMVGDVNILMGGKGTYHPHRRFDANISSISFHLHHTYTGHQDLRKAWEGITALIYRIREQFQFISNSCDIILINSFEHDVKGNLNAYLNHARNLFALLRTLFENKNKRIFWKGQFYHSRMSHAKERKKYDDEIRKLIYGNFSDIINYVDINTVFHELPPINIVEYHIGQGHFAHDVSLLWTSAMSQTILNSICNSVEITKRGNLRHI